MSTLDILRAATREVNESQSQENLDILLLETTKEIAKENEIDYNLKNIENLSLSYSADLNQAPGKMASTYPSAKNKSPNVSPNSRTNVIDDANDGLEDDVNALLGSMISNGEIDIATLKANQEKKQNEDDLNEDYEYIKKVLEKNEKQNEKSQTYKKLLQRKLTESTTFVPSQRSKKKTYNAEACRLSKLLASYESTGKPSIVPSVTQEMLFKSMRILRPSSARSKSDSNSTKSDNNSSSFDMINYLSRPSTANAPPSSSKHGSAAGDLSREKVFARYEDAKECTFRPKIKKTSNNLNSTDEKPSSFVQRQENKELYKHNRLKDEIGKAEYDALVDKKYCPKCGAQQKYDEIKEKKKNCPQCNVQYANKVVWGKVSKQFMNKNKQAVQNAFANWYDPHEDLKRAEAEVKGLADKMNKDYQRAIQRATEMKEKHEEDLRMRHINISKHKLNRLNRDPEVEFKQAVEEAEKAKHETYELYKKAIEKAKFLRIKLNEFLKAEEKFKPKNGLGFTDKKWDSDLESEFFSRMEMSLEKREEKLEKIEREVIYEKYPFRPNIHSARSKDDEEEFDENYDAFEAFLERYESDLEHRKEKSAAFWDERRRIMEETNLQKYHTAPFKC